MIDFPKDLVVTIDGPSGSGKSTIAGLLAEKLGGKRLDTGAIYRSFAYYVHKNSIELSEEMLAKEAENFSCEFKDDGSIILNGEDISGKIRTPEVSSMASKIATRPEVRKGLLNLQRKLAENGPVVCEGRDMGTVVFPDARVKFFLTASPETRAKRRYLELKGKGNTDVSYEMILKDQKERDERDSTRKIAPLRRPEDAVLADSEGKNIDDMVNFCFEEIVKRLA